MITEGSSRTKVQIDWRGTYKNFKEQHGGDPVLYKGRLVFRDGWQHSASDYKGPEYSPPTDPAALNELKCAYWRTRLGVIREELYELQRRYNDLKQVQASRSGMLQQRYVTWDEEGKRSVEVGDLDFEAIKGRLDWLRSDVEQCEEQLRSLTEEEDDDAQLKRE